MTATPPLLVLMDGHAVAYRQFFAMQSNRQFSTTTGQSTGAIYGFTRTLIEILEDQPHYLALTFDRGLSGREALYPDYKGTRDKMPAELISQMAYMERMAEAFNIPQLLLEGYEADDVIGTVCGQAVAAGCEVLIITGDRDLLQLISPHIRVQLPNRQEKTDKIWDEAAFAEGYQGLRPAQLIELKALMGDTSDNIPGVKGIGEKGAMDLIRSYGDLEGLYAQLGELKPKTQALLAAGRDSAFLSRELATIKRDLPLQLDLAACLAHDFDPQAVMALFDELQFGPGLRGRLAKTWRAQFEAANIALEAEDLSGQIFVPPHEIITSPEQLTALAQKLGAAKLIAFDTETTGLDKMQAALVGISLCLDGQNGYYIPLGHRGPAAGPQPSLFGFENTPPPAQLNVQEVIAALRPAMTDPAIPKAAHNAGYDWVMLKRAGLEVAPVTEDTMLAEFVLNPDSSQGNLGLKRAAWRRLKLNMRNIDEIIGSGKGQISMAQVDLPQAAAYASADAVATYRLVGALGQAFRADPNPQARALYENLEMPLIRVLSEMEMAGILVDLPYLRELGADLEARMAAMAEEVYALAGEKFSLNSTKQLNVILFEKLGLSGAGLKKTQSQGFSLTASVLEDLAERENHPILQPLMAYRSLVKLHNTYVEALPELIHPVTGRVHTSFNQTGAITGRISSNNPNLQNIPIRTEEGRRVRGAFIAAPGHLLLSVDYSQIELRILAHFSGDETLRAAFQQGEDVHRSTAAKIHHIPLEAVTYEQRRFAKAVNFGLMYGMGAYRLTRDSDLTLGESQKFIEQYFATFPTVKDYLETTKAFAKQEGYVQTLFGRRRYFPDLQTEGLGHNARNRAEREAINAPIQGTAADIMKKAMILLDGRLQRAGLRAKLLLQVHDELVLEAPEDEVDSLKALVTEAMLEAGSILSVPVGVEARAGANWAEMG